MDRLYVREVGRRYRVNGRRYVKLYRCMDTMEMIEFLRRLQRKGRVVSLSTAVADFVYVMPPLPGIER